MSSDTLGGGRTITPGDDSLAELEEQVAERVIELRQAVDSLSREAAGRQRTISPMAEQYRSLFEAGSEGYVVHDNGIIIEVNPQLEELLGFKSSELVGESVMNLVAEESRALVAERLRAPLRKPFEVEGLRKDGTRVQVELLGKAHVHDPFSITRAGGASVKRRRSVTSRTSRTSSRLARSRVASSVFGVKYRKCCSI